LPPLTPPRSYPKLTKIYKMNDESRDLVKFPKEGGLNVEDLVAQMSRPGLSSLADPGEHMKYWALGKHSKKHDF
ncbi:hypothetical protein TeGR_g5947, partial [Tetraparma gracilis]